jgi:hypothetical protein
MPLAVIVPNVGFPPKTPRPPTGPTYQRIVLVDPPVSVAVNVTGLAEPDGIVMGADGEVIVTTGAGVIVTVAEAPTF